MSLKYEPASKLTRVCAQDTTWTVNSCNS